MLGHGETLGQYTLLRRLASGGMGDVYLAAKAGPMGFGPYVALKVLKRELEQDAQFIDMLIDEANISMNLSHQNVVSVLDFSKAAGRHFIAMEYIHGVTVERIIELRLERDEVMPPPQVLFVGSELSRALRYAHTRTGPDRQPLNIVHRDVTPGNVLISVHGEVKLTDFGIARAKGRIQETQAGILKGKFGYMAPEAVRGDDVDHRADLFGLGVCLYLMATGHHPTAHCSLLEAIDKFEKRQIAPPRALAPQIGPRFEAIIMRALDPEPSERWSSAHEMGEALQDCLLSSPAWRSQSNADSLATDLRRLAPDVFREPLSGDERKRVWEAARAGRGDRSPPGEAALVSSPDSTDPVPAPDPDVGSEGWASVDELLAEPEIEPSQSLPYVEDDRTIATPGLSLEAVDDDRTIADFRPHLSAARPAPTASAVADSATELAVVGPSVGASSETDDEGAGPTLLRGLAFEETGSTDSDPSIPRVRGSDTEDLVTTDSPWFQSLGPSSGPKPAAEPWSDDADARRLLATRGAVAEEPETDFAVTAREGPAPPTVPLPAAALPDAGAGAGEARPARARGGLIAAAFGVLLLAAAGYLLLGTEMLWPRLDVRSEPPGARIIIDGVERGTTPALIAVQPRTDHRLELRLAGHTPAARQVTAAVREGKTYAVEVELRPFPEVEVKPAGAEVWVNGRKVGAGPQVELGTLPEVGTIDLRIRADGHRTFERTYQHRAQFPDRLEVRLDPNPSPPARRSVRDRSSRD